MWQWICRIRRKNYLNKIDTPAVSEALAAGDMKKAWLAELADLNVCSQKGLVEMFDGSIGAGSVYMPFGGKYQLTETQSMVAKIPVMTGKIRCSHDDGIRLRSVSVFLEPVSRCGVCSA